MKSDLNSGRPSGEIRICTDVRRESRLTTPSALSKELRDIFLMRSHPSYPRRGLRCGLTKRSPSCNRMGGQGRQSRLRGFRRRQSHLSRHGLSLRESPFSIQDFRAWTVEPNEIVPSRRDRQAVGNLAVADAELNGDRSVRILPGSDVVQRVRIEFIFFKIALGVIHTNGP